MTGDTKQEVARIAGDSLEDSYIISVDDVKRSYPEFAVGMDPIAEASFRELSMSIRTRIHLPSRHYLYHAYAHSMRTETMFDLVFEAEVIKQQDVLGIEQDLVRYNELNPDSGISMQDFYLIAKLVAKGHDVGNLAELGEMFRCFYWGKEWQYNTPEDFINSWEELAAKGYFPIKVLEAGNTPKGSENRSGELLSTLYFYTYLSKLKNKQEPIDTKTLSRIQAHCKLIEYLCEATRFDEEGDLDRPFARFFKLIDRQSMYAGRNMQLRLEAIALLIAEKVKEESAEELTLLQVINYPHNQLQHLTGNVPEAQRVASFFESIKFGKEKANNLAIPLPISTPIEYNELYAKLTTPMTWEELAKTLNEPKVLAYLKEQSKISVSNII